MLSVSPVLIFPQISAQSGPFEFNVLLLLHLERHIASDLARWSYRAAEHSPLPHTLFSGNADGPAAALPTSEPMQVWLGGHNNVIVPLAFTFQTY